MTLMSKKPARDNDHNLLNPGRDKIIFIRRNPQG